MNVGDRAEVKIETVAFGGDGVGRIQNMVVFIPFTVDGDVVEAEIKAVKKRYAKAIVRRIIKASPHRIEPECRYFFRCGGCQYQHVSYDHQLRMKTRQVAESFQRIGNITSPPLKEIIPSPKAFLYRGNAEYHLNDEKAEDLKIGFTDPVGREVIDIERCEIVDESINRSYKKFRKEAMIGGADILASRHVFWSEVGYPVPSQITRVVNGKELQVPMGGFFQANTVLTGDLVDRIIAMSSLDTSKVVLDCYCGSGLFSIFVSPRAAKVFGIEHDRSSVGCARFNLRNNGCSNGVIYHGKVEQILNKKFIGKDFPIDVVLLDPPRMGCTNKVLSQILLLEPKKIIYISCNPAAQARDVRYLSDRGWHLKELQPLDMFPQTKHIETIALIEKMP